MKKLFVTVAIAALVMSGARAQAKEFYVVQDTSTKKCTIVDKRPTTTTTVVLGDDKVFPSRAKAKLGMKGIKACSK